MDAVISGRATATATSWRHDAGWMKGEFQSIRFDDSDVFKIIEGATYSSSLKPAQELEEYILSLYSAKLLFVADDRAALGGHVQFAACGYQAIEGG